MDAALQGKCHWCGSIIDPLTHARVIIEETALAHRIPSSDIYGPSRKAQFVAARGCAIRRIREETNLKLVAIGDLLGRDHSTIIHHLNGNGATDAAAATTKEARF